MHGARPRELAPPADHEREPVERFRRLCLVSELRGQREARLAQLLRAVEVSLAVGQLAPAAEYPGPEGWISPVEFEHLLQPPHPLAEVAPYVPEPPQGSS
jgi:hypothetical protein